MSLKAKMTRFLGILLKKHLATNSSFKPLSKCGAQSFTLFHFGSDFVGRVAPLTAFTTLLGEPFKCSGINRGRVTRATSVNQYNCRQYFGWGNNES